MEKLHCHNNLFPLFLVLLQFSSLLLLSSSYTRPDKYFINCGSDSNTTVSGRIFIGDINSGSYSLSPGQSSPVKDANASTDTSLYQTARIYKYPSSYDLNIAQSGTYMVRLHFYAFSSPLNLSSALFNISTSNFSLLSNFRGQNNSNSPVIKEFLLAINEGKFEIHFIPSQESSLAFVNAIEVFLAPPGFIDSKASYITPAGEDGSYDTLLSQVLNTVHRINVGGDKVTPENDTLWRNWIPDDDFLFYQGAAKNSEYHSDRPKYQDGGATVYSAPDYVYQTAKELNINSSRQSNFFNITWLFDVSKNAKHLVRLHFCDIVSHSYNDDIKFNLYIYSKFSQIVQPSVKVYRLAAPFYIDFVVDSDNSGLMNISIGPPRDSVNTNAFLNGLEIMELMKESGSVPVQREKKEKWVVFVIVGSVGGVVVLICTLLAVVFLGQKRRKAKPVETVDWPSLGESSYSKKTEKTENASPVQNLNLGLKMPFSEIQYATNNFDRKLMIGEGGFGKVYKGSLQSGVKVAVKRSEPGHGQGLPEFQAEIMVLSKIRHRHLVSLIGYCDERSEMILVYEFMEKGTLREHLYRDSDGSSSRSELSWKQRLDICIGSARGLHYLHTGLAGGIIHRDVKSTNILLDENYVAKVADFGLSRSGPLEASHVSTVVKGSFGYLDPEYFRCLQLTDKSDVYSFGVVLLEVLCARPAIFTNPLPGEQVNLAEWGMYWQKKGELHKIIDPFLVGKINPNSLRKFGETAEKCLKEYGADRPTMGDVLWDLEYVLQLQQTAVHREPHEDSMLDASLELPLLPIVQRLPSHSIPVEVLEEGDESIVDSSYTNASEVFSQLKIDEAR